MFDPNREDFDARVLRLRREHALGRGFDAAGTLGRAAFRRDRRHHSRALRAGLFLMAFAFGMKGALHHNLGPDLYAARVAAMQDGSALSTVQTALMGADPVTVLVSAAIEQVTTRL